MEQYKTLKPEYSQACEKLYKTIIGLMMPDNELNPGINFSNHDTSQNFQAELSKLSDTRTQENYEGSIESIEDGELDDDSLFKPSTDKIVIRAVTQS